MDSYFFTIGFMYIPIWQSYKILPFQTDIFVICDDYLCFLVFVIFCRIHNWIQDYWGMRDQVVALEEMIKDGAKDSSKLFEVMEDIYNENHRP